MSKETKTNDADVNQIFEDILMTEERLTDEGYSVSTNQFVAHKNNNKTQKIYYRKAIKKELKEGTQKDITWGITEALR